MEKERKRLSKAEYLEIIKELTEQLEKQKMTEEVNNKHDKTFKIILENKEEAANLINKVLELDQKISVKDLQKHNRSFITKNLKLQEADIVYKLKNKKVFILIEHQTKVDYSMAYRILNYQIEIMRNCVDDKKVKNKNYEHALVIAIVLYTGARKWTAKRQIQEIQTKFNLNIISPILENYYYIIDINDYTNKELLEKESFLSKIMLLEKSRSKEEVIKNLYEIVPRTTEENKEILLEIVNYTLNNYIDKETIKKITNKIKEGSGNMLAVVEMLEKERQRDIKKGIKIGEARGEARGAAKNTLKLAKRMLKENFTIEIIEKITGLKREKFM